MLGIDISSNNPGYQSYSTAGLSWCCIKATQGTGYRNPLAAAQADWSRSKALIVGFYHWVEPWADARIQADYFTSYVAELGPHSFWALDCEDSSRPASDVEWGQCVSQVDQRVTQVLGDHGLIYVGRYFHPATLLQLAQGRWWLPDYATNDGVQHPLPQGVNPVVHQFTSQGGLDRNIVLDQTRWNLILGAPAPQPAPEKKMENVWIGYVEGQDARYIIGFGTKHHIGNGAVYAEWKAQAGFRNVAVLERPCTQAFLDDLTNV